MAPGNKAKAKAVAAAAAPSRRLFAALHAGNTAAFAAELGDVLSSAPEFRVEECLSSDRSGDTLLHVACRLGSVQVLQHLITTFRDPALNLRVTNHEGKSPLHEAAQFCQAETVTWLLDVGRVPVDPLKRADWTPLMLACTKRGNLSVVDALLKHGADNSLANKDGWTPFHLACREGDVNIMGRLIQVCPDSWRTKSKNGRTPLHSSAQAGDLTSLTWLLDMCPFPTDEQDSCGSTSLMDALRLGRTDCAAVLVAKGHDLKKTDKMERDCFKVACHAGQAKAVRWLIDEHGADVNGGGCCSKNGMAPLHWAALEGQCEVMEILLEKGADKEAKDGRGRTAIDMARALRNGKEAVEMLSPET